MKRRISAVLWKSAGVLGATALATTVWAQQDAPVLVAKNLPVEDPFLRAGISQELWTVNNLWIMIAGMMVFLMHLGFACLESGLTRAKNVVNVLFKNITVVMIGIVVYALFGWKVMYPGEENWIISNLFSFGFGIGAEGGDSGGYHGVTPAYNHGYTLWTDFFFQAMFAATCCTIISGAVAERIRLLPFLIFCVPFTGLIYCVSGSWKWGGGWLESLGFVDFAGSTLVHAVGGAGALAGVLMLGPRLGKYARDGQVQPIPGHSMPLATMGTFLLWFGWFGFNGGSELTADPGAVSYVLVTTLLSACGGGLAAMTVSWLIGGKPDLSMALNGILGGLVGITAGPDLPSWPVALLLIGAVSGVICYAAILLLDRLRMDDPVGAVAVHGFCGLYGTLACGFSGGFDARQLGIQAFGAVICILFSFIGALLFFSLLKVSMGLRVTPEEELEGLDLGEHDMSAYPDFQRTYIKSYHAREL